MDYQISQGFLVEPGRTKEYAEGVRALIVDKDKNPKWTHSSINQVTVDQIGKYFDRPELLNTNIMMYNELNAIDGEHFLEKALNDKDYDKYLT